MNPDRNFLAYLRNKCYSLRVFNNVIILDMRSVKKIMASFSGAAAALGLATSPVFATDLPENTVSYGGQTCEIQANPGGISALLREVPTLDRHEQSKDGVRSITQAASTNRIAVAVYGSDGLFVQAVMQAVYDARECGLNVGGLTLGTATEPSGVDVFADHSLTNEIHGINDRLDAENFELWRSGVLEGLMRADAQLREWQAEERPVTLGALDVSGLH